jgi:hypothetical protein
MNLRGGIKGLLEMEFSAELEYLPEMLGFILEGAKRRR